MLFFVGAAVLTTVMIGLRFNVGGDWATYQSIYDYISYLTLPESLTATDPGYGAINWLAAQIGLGIGFVNLVCAIFFMGGLSRLAWRQPNPALAVLVAVPYLIIVVAMGYTRQAAAIGLVCFAITDASEKRLVRLIILIGIATLLHKSAILMLPVALVPVFRKNIYLGALGSIIFILVFYYTLGKSSDLMVATYVTSKYDSQGALIRVVMNVIPAAVFLLFRGRFILPPFQKTFWTTCCVLAFASLTALFIASASSGIDRLSLYLIPLQVIVYSRLPYILLGKSRGSSIAILLVIIYSCIVEFVWLNYSDNSRLWIPYSNQILSSD